MISFKFIHFIAVTEQSSDESMSSEELNNLSNIEDYLTSINVKKKRRRTIRLKQCSIRQSNRPRYYRYSLRKVKPTVQRFQIHTEKNTSEFNYISSINCTFNS